MTTDRATLSTHPGPTLDAATRDRLIAEFERDGFTFLPDLLDEDLRAACVAASDALHEDAEAAIKLDNCVDLHPAFRRLMMWTPALQLCHDLLGPSFQLNQSNLIVRPPAPDAGYDFTGASQWHADGPRPRNFPTVDGVRGLHYVKFGFFFTDTRSAGSGALQVVRGSHRRPELDGRGADFRIEDHAGDVVDVACEPGRIVVFHQALWHHAPPNVGEHVRRNCYLSFSPTWMRPFDRVGIGADEAAGLAPEEAFLLGAPRPWRTWWLPTDEEKTVLDRYAR